MDAKVIVVVSDDSDSRRGEVTVVDDSRSAARLVETLLQAGYRRERIQLFNGHQTALRVTQRPVVSMLQGQPPSPRRTDVPMQTAEEEHAEPFVKSGVRFSSLFRAG